MSQNLNDRLIDALKGRSRFAGAQYRVVVSQATTRERSPGFNVDTLLSVLGGTTHPNTPAPVTLNTPGGNHACMTDLPGFADGAEIVL